MKLCLPTWKEALLAGLFAIRHGMVVLVLTLLVCGLWTAIYFPLLIIAILGGYPIDSPLFYPLVLLLLIVLFVGVGWGIFTPACAAGRLFCWLTRFPKLTAIPVVFLTAMGIVALLRFFLTRDEDSALVMAIGDMFGYDLLLLAISLGIYWWLTEGPGALWDAISRFINRKQQMTTGKIVGVEESTLKLTADDDPPEL